MIETELKIAVDAAEMARLRRHGAFAGLREAPRKTERLLSIYCDTSTHALAQAGMSLRLRRIGRRWVQTVKSGRLAGGAGFFSHQEVECAAPGGRLVLDGADPSGVYALIRAEVGEAALVAVFETRVERVTERLRLPGLGVVELALDRGEVVAGDAKAPILEVELELVEGDVAAVFELARQLFRTGPVRFATANKAALGYRLARGEGPPTGVQVRGAGNLSFDRGATVERVARDVFRDCFAQIAQNMAVVAQSEAIEGPHQLRVGLRRLRTAFAAFGPILGGEAIAPVAAAARDLGQVVGRLRDIDVLIDEVVRDAGAYGLDDAARAALVARLSVRRAQVRDAVRAELAGPTATAFLFDLLVLIETRGWLAPSDYSQTERLAATIGQHAPQMLARRHRKVLRKGKRIGQLDSEALHALRKDLKKLRYTVDALAPIHSGRKFTVYLRALKDMQDTFGSLNDAAMAAEALLGADAPAADDGAAQRGVGWVLGTLAVRVRDDRPRLYGRWKDFAATRPFWTKPETDQTAME